MWLSSLLSLLLLVYIYIIYIYIIRIRILPFFIHTHMYIYIYICVHELPSIENGNVCRSAAVNCVFSPLGVANGKDSPKIRPKIIRKPSNIIKMILQHVRMLEVSHPITIQCYHLVIQHSSGKWPIYRWFMMTCQWKKGWSSIATWK